jgi:hypothetical protein
MDHAQQAIADNQEMLPEWLTFPVLAEAWGQSAEKTIANMADRAAYYQELSVSAPPMERVHARLIAKSYSQVHAVLQELYAKQTASKTPVQKTTLGELKEE